MRLVKNFRDGSQVCFDKGRFDDWCVYYIYPNGSRKAPKDVDYFSSIKRLDDIYGSNIVYNLIFEVFQRTTKDVDDRILDYITEQCQAKFGTQSLEADKNITFIYMGMIAEENKKNAKVKKRIKMLGIHYLLKEHKSVNDSATCLCGMNSDKILEECAKRNI